jgi:peptide/nickel transport system substrate-binding protein
MWSPKRGRRRRSVAVVSTVLVGTMALAACGSGGHQNAASGKQGDTLTVAVAFGPPTLDPAYVGASAQWAWPVGLAYEPLIIFTPDGTFDGGLAEEFGFEGSGNSKFNITLRSGLKFADGTPLTATEAVASLEYSLKQPGNTQRWASQVTSVDPDGELGLTLNCDPGCPDLPYVLSQNAQLGEIISPAGLKDPKKLATTTFGAGPYILDPAKSVTGDHYAYDANPNYWNESAVHFKHVVFRVVADANARLSSLKSGQVDLIDVLADSAPAVSAASNLKLMEVKGAAFQGLVINDRTGKVAPELKDVRVRQALNYAVDREAIAKALGYSAGTVQMTGPGSGAWDESLEETYPYDPDKAKALLAEAGYPNGFTLKVETHEQGDLSKYVQAAVSYWEKIGIKVDLTTDKVVDNWITAIANQQFAISGYLYGTLPFSIQSIDFYSDAGGPFNAYEQDPKVRELLDEVPSADDAQREDIYKQVNQYSVENGFGVPLSVTSALWAYSDKISVPQATSANSIPLLNEIAPVS